MSGSTLGQIFKVSTFGESHGKAIGVVIDGCPAGLEIDEGEMRKYIERRKPKSKFSTPRHEPDDIEILSGIMNNKTLGTPICIQVKNKNFNSDEYEPIKEVFRPGHADLTYEKKFGIRDYRGGGRNSGRETVARTIAGYIAKKFLSKLKISIHAYTFSINKIHIKNIDCSPEDNFLFMPDKTAFKQAEDFLNQCPEDDSIGGIVECVIKNVKAGIGEPVFDKLDAEISKAVMSIGAVKGIEFGTGFNGTYLFGSQNNDQFCVQENEIKKKSNNSGGILGGISDGGEIIFRAAVKPTPSIAKKQICVTRNKKEIEIELSGRHDKIIVPRIVVVIESMVAITLMDQILLSCTSKLSDIEKNYFSR